VSWRFPKFRYRSGQVPNVDDINRNFYPVTEEAAGKLNEHNWAAGAIPDLGKVENDAAFVWHQTGYYSDLLDSTSGSPFPGWDPGNNTHNEFSVEYAWREAPYSRVSFTSPACLLWIHGSVQITFDTAGSAGLANILNFAISIDGAIIPESIVGGVETSIDRTPGLQSQAIPVASSIVFPVGPGEHIVSMVIQLTKEPGETVDRTFMNSRELICLEMRR